ncbi:unnamed protein product [Pylaiella littoralis]
MASMDEDGGEAELREGFLSLSLTEDHGDLKTYEKNVHETMARFPELRGKRLKDYESVFALVETDDTARTRRKKVTKFFMTNVNENLNREVSHQCLMLIDELRELLDRLVSWVTLCLPANDHPLSVSHRLKLKRFKSRLRTEMKRLEGDRAGVLVSCSSRAKTIRAMCVTKKVPVNNIPAWEAIHHEFLASQETEVYLLMCRVWTAALNHSLMTFNYWKVNLKDADIAFAAGQNASGNHDFFS